MTALAYGVGHGGIEAMLIVGLTMVSNVALLLLAESGTVTDPTVLEAAATGTHAGMNFLAVVLNSRVSVVVTEQVVLLCAALAAVWAAWIWKNFWNSAEIS